MSAKYEAAERMAEIIANSLRPAKKYCDTTEDVKTALNLLEQVMNETEQNVFNMAPRTIIDKLQPVRRLLSEMAESQPVDEDRAFDLFSDIYEIRYEMREKLLAYRMTNKAEKHDLLYPYYKLLDEALKRYNNPEEDYEQDTPGLN